MAKNKKITPYLYYAVRVTQRVSMVSAFLFMICVYILNISVAVIFLNTDGTTGRVGTDFVEVTSGLGGKFMHTLIFTCAYVLMSSLAMLLFKRARKGDKRFVVDGVAIGTAILILGIFAQPILKAFISMLPY